MTIKRVLLVGNGNHQFVTNYAKWLKKESVNVLTIDILSLTVLSGKNKRYYDTVYYRNENSRWNKIISKLKGIKTVYRLYSYKKIIDKLPVYDFIHFHFISRDCYYIVKQIRKRYPAKIILSIWGSDMYQLSSANFKDFIRTCLKADFLTFTNNQSIDYFVKKFHWQKDNLRLCRFGLEPLDILKKLSLTKLECKRELGWNPNKLAITIGYNLSSNQQHLEILNTLGSKEIAIFKDYLLLVLPITYGGNIHYKKELITRLNQLQFEYIIYDVFLEDETIAFIRKASDIMIQLQKTDQFSGSMQEHLFARNIVITGTWLPYSSLKGQSVWFIEIDNLKELGDTILDVINNYKEYEAKTTNNTNAIAELSSWEKNIYDWIKLYST